MPERFTGVTQFRAASGASPVGFDGGSGVLTGRAVAYGVVDDYGSLWSPGCFNEGLHDPGYPLPSICLGHDWSNVVGLVASWEDKPADGLYVSAQLDDPVSVPEARKAWAQMQSGSVSQLSVGFTVPRGGRRDPTPEEMVAFPGVEEVIERAILDEVSLVLRGAVPGAKVLATRQAGAKGGRRRLVDWSSRGALDAEITRRWAMGTHHG